MKVVVRVRDYADIDSAVKAPTEVGVHFDVSGAGKPEHFVRIDRSHAVAGSTSGWNNPDYNGMDPFGDWTDCVANNWPLIQTRPRTNKGHLPRTSELLDRQRLGSVLCAVVPPVRGEEGEG